MKKIVGLLLIALWLDGWALEPAAGVHVTTLAKEGASWDGKPVVYPQGEAQVTAMLIEIAPGAETGWHHHPVPSFGYLLEGNLDLTLDDGRVKHLRAGEALVEVVNRPHNGRNAGAVPAKIVVFYAGTVDLPLSVKEARK